MEAKFTKGEWKKFDTSTKNKWVNVNREEDWLLHARLFFGAGISKEEAEANAHLVAAAPNMYEALEAFILAVSEQTIIIQENTDNDGRENEGWRLYNMALAALKKAKGE